MTECSASAVERIARGTLTHLVFLFHLLTPHLQQTGRQTDRQTNRQADKQTGRQTEDRHVRLTV